MKTRLFSMLLIVFLLLAGCGKAAGTPAPVSPAAASQAAANPTAEASATSNPTAASGPSAPPDYPIVDTGQGKCYDKSGEIPCPADGAFFGQDAQYTGLEPAFKDNGDGSVTDQNTGLVWQKSPDSDGNGKVNAADKQTFQAAGAYCDNLSLAGADDWRLPDIKTLYSLIDFRGTNTSGATGLVDLIPFLDNAYFKFVYGDTAAGEGTSAAQFVSNSVYADTTSNEGGKVFGVNFADGLIQGYGKTAMKFYVLCVRGDSAYGANRFADNGDETVSDLATGLVWQKADSAKGMDWQAALAYCEGLSLGGKDDWRLPDAKSLQSLVDYTRAPVPSNTAAIDLLFGVTGIKNEAGQSDYPYYWSGTTHVDWTGKGGRAVYVAFGRAMGYVNGAWVDVHAAGAQLSDPKSGNPADFPNGSGPQGEAVRILNYARCVRAGNVTATPEGHPKDTRQSIPVDVTAPLPTEIGLPDGGGGGGGSPSPEAIAACTGKSVGDACHYDTIIGRIDGHCSEFFIPNVIKVLACFPNLP